jgi:hypothetical protein
MGVNLIPVQKTLNSEDVIRSYLKAIDDPSSLVDDTAIASLENEVRAASDPLVKLRALAALNRAKTPHADAFREGFIENARAWALANDVPFETFAELGVSRDVLRAAGLLASRSRGRSSAVAPSTSRRSVTVHQLEQDIQRREGVFTLADVARDIGGSPMTVRKAVDKLVKAGSLVKLGPTPGWTGRGRAPLQFRKS